MVSGAQSGVAGKGVVCSRPNSQELGGCQLQPATRVLGFIVLWGGGGEMGTCVHSGARQWQI